MLQIQKNDSLSQFLVDSLMELYQKLTFPQREFVFEISLPKDAQLPKKNPPYPSSMFLDMTKHIVSLVSYLLGYQFDQWVDEPILGFLSVLSIGEKADFMFHYS